MFSTQLVDPDIAPTSYPGAWGTFANLKIQVIFMDIRTYAAQGLTLTKFQRKKCLVELKKKPKNHWCLSTSKRAQRSLFSGERSVCDPPLNPDIHSLQAISCFVNYVPPGHLFSSSYTNSMGLYCRHIKPWLLTARHQRLWASARGARDCDKKSVSDDLGMGSGLRIKSRERMKALTAFKGHQNTEPYYISK